MARLKCSQIESQVASVRVDSLHCHELLMDQEFGSEDGEDGDDRLTFRVSFGHYMHSGASSREKGPSALTTVHTLSKEIRTLETNEMDSVSLFVRNEKVLCKAQAKLLTQTSL